MRKRAACAKYLGHTIEYMKAMSVGDIQYPLKTQQSGAGQAKKGKSVWNTKFFADVNAMLNEPIDRFKMNLSRIDPHGDGKRCMLVPTRKTVEATITVLKEQAEGEGIEADITPQTVKRSTPRARAEKPHGSRFSGSCTRGTRRPWTSTSRGDSATSCIGSTRSTCSIP